MPPALGCLTGIGSFILFPIIFLLPALIKQIEEYERGVKFTMGRYSSIMQPGWRIVLPIFQKYRKVDMRTKVSDVPDQDTMTKDNIPVAINAVIYYKIVDAAKAVLEIENYHYAVLQLAQTTMRNMIGETDLDTLLSERESLATKIKNYVDQATESWGIDVESVEIKDIALPDSLKRTMAKQAEAEREKRAVIINSEGEVTASRNLAEAAQLLAESPGALHLRTLNSINDLSSDQSNTVIFCIPLEVLRALEGLKKG